MTRGSPPAAGAASPLARRRAPGLGLGLALGLGLGLAVPLGAQPAVTDARSVARAGQDGVRLLESSPGAEGREGTRLRLDLQRLYAGTGIVVGAVAVETIGARAGAALAFAGMWTPVGKSQSLRCAVQARGRGFRAGLGAEVRCISILGYASAWEIVPRAGCGWSSGPFACAAGLERIPGPEPLPRLALALEYRLAPGIACGLESEREPGLPAACRVGLGLDSGAVEFLAGFEASTQTCSLGLSVDWSAGTIDWGAWTHPALGWSHAWSYAVTR